MDRQKQAMPTKFMLLLYSMHRSTHTCKQIQDVYMWQLSYSAADTPYPPR